jgi:hypothetical protein
MPVTSKEITAYSVSVISDADPNHFAATMRLFDAARRTIAFLRFFSPGSAPAPNEFRTDLGYPLVSYPSSSLAALIDVLRNEKPVYFIWYDYMPARCFGAVDTSREPVGEGDTP